MKKKEVKGRWRKEGGREVGGVVDPAP